MLLCCIKGPPRGKRCRGSGKLHHAFPVDEQSRILNYSITASHRLHKRLRSEFSGILLIDRSHRTEGSLWKLFAKIKRVGCHSPSNLSIASAEHFQSSCR